MLGAVARKLFGSANDRRIRSYQPRVDAINALEPELKALSDEALKARTAEFKKQVAEGASLAGQARKVVVVEHEGHAVAGQHDVALDGKAPAHRRPRGADGVLGNRRIVQATMRDRPRRQPREDAGHRQATSNSASTSTAASSGRAGTPTAERA